MESIQTAAPVAAIIMLGVGVLGMLIGYKIFRIFLVLSGMLVGAILGGYLLQNAEPAIQAVGALVIAVLFGWLAYRLVKFVFYVVGAVLGLAVGFGVGYLLGVSDPAMVLILVVGVSIGVGLGAVLEKLIIIVATAVLGASYALTGAHLLMPQAHILDRNADGNAGTVAFVLWVALSILSILYQYRNSREWRASK